MLSRMRLILKFTLLFLLVSMGVFFLGGVITYQIVKREIDFEQERFLVEHLQSVTRMIERRQPTKPFLRDKIQIYPLSSSVEETEIQYSDTLVMHSTLERLEPHIKLDVTKRIGGNLYRISIFDLIIEEDDIIESVRESMIKIYLLLIAVMLLVGVVASWHLFKPFNRTLQKIRDFRIDQSKPIQFHNTRTVEFKRLNTFLEEMTDKIQRDYQSLKEFAENASHEMQTPLTNAIGKLELLLTSGNLEEEETDKVIATLGSLKHLSRMGQSMNLLTKIDNREFQNIEKINFTKKLNSGIENFKELMDLKSISFQIENKEDVLVSMDPTLSTMLINNLLSNAIRHNDEHGFIKTFLDESRFTIINSGHSLSVEPNTLFDRFRKGRQQGDGLGLGLAIVKKICDASGFSVDYTSENSTHKLEILFKIKL